MMGPIRSFRLHALTAALGLLGAVGMVVGYLTYGDVISAKQRYALRAVVPTSAALAGGARVTMAGAEVGQVTGVSRQGHGTVIEMELDDDRVHPIPQDTRLTVSQRTPVGEAYVALTPGRSSQRLPEGSVLPMQQSDEYVDVDEILTILRGRPEEQIRRLVQGLGGALDRRGDDLNATLGGASRVVQSSGGIFVTLQRSKEQTAGLVESLGRVSASISERGEAIASIASRGLVAMRALGDRDDELARTLEVLPSTLAQVERTSGTLERTAAAATPVVGELSRTVRALRPVIADLAPAAATGRRVVGELDRAAGPLTETIREASRLSRPLSEALPDLHKTVCQLNPMVRYIAPYARDLVMPLIGLGSSSNSYDAIGHMIRLQPIVGENSAVGVPENVSRAMHTLLRSGLFAKGQGLTWNPYPAPGTTGTEGAKETGNIFNAQALKESGYVFPRIHSDC